MDINKDVAMKAGVSAAIVYGVIEDECKVRGVSFEGHPFARLAIRDIQEKIPYLTTRTITRAIKRLEDNHLIECKLFIGTTKWRRPLK